MAARWEGCGRADRQQQVSGGDDSGGGVAGQCIRIAGWDLTGSADGYLRRLCGVARWVVEGGSQRSGDQLAQMFACTTL